VYRFPDSRPAGKAGRDVFPLLTIVISPRRRNTVDCFRVKVSLSGVLDP
jgi:hypothetical protein